VGAITGNVLSVSPQPEHVDAGTRRFLAELRDLKAGAAASSGTARVQIFTRWGGATGPLILIPGLAITMEVFARIRFRSHRRYYAALFDVDARNDERSRLVVPLESDPQLSGVEAGTSSTWFGALEPGRAVAVTIGDNLYLPIGPASRPWLGTPRCRWAT
jgi:hypothetical protein